MRYYDKWMNFLLLIILAMNVAFNSQKYVVVEVRSKSVEVENEKPFPLFVSIKPAVGIHVNVGPPISIKSPDKSTTLNIKDMPKSGEYLDPSRPIEVEGEIRGVNIGRYKIIFTVGYTYCSEKEGWCRMGNDTVSVTVNVKK